MLASPTYDKTERMSSTWTRTGRPVEFGTSLCDTTCREGDTLNLRAFLIGEPPPTVTWYVNGRKLIKSENIRIYDEQGTFMVTITDITCDYSGKVLCEARNDCGTALSEAMLLVLPRGEPPDFIEWLCNVRAPRGARIKHRVVFTGDPTPDLTWYINGKELTKSDKDISIVTYGNESTLTFLNFDPARHEGEIVCKAANDAGEICCMATQTECDPNEVYSDDESEDDSVTPTAGPPPAFIKKLEDTTVEKGSPARLECIVPDGAVVQWLKDGKPLEVPPRFRVETRRDQGGTLYALVIDDTAEEDAGAYTVIMQTPAGRATCQAKLTVVGKTATMENGTHGAPEFVELVRSCTVPEGDGFKLTCRVSGSPKPKIRWTKDGKEVVMSCRIRVNFRPDGTITLECNDAKKEDAGDYRCFAENEYGSAWTEAPVTVVSVGQDVPAGGAPDFVQPLKPVVVLQGQTAVLEGKICGDPTPTVKWCKNGKELHNDDRIHIESLKDGTQRLTIKNANVEDQDEYTLEASNEFGDVGCDVTLTVTETEESSQEFKKALSDTTVTRGKKLRLSVKDNGSSRGAKWFKNNKQIVESSTTRIEKISDDEYILEIDEVDSTDSGNYKVVLSNDSSSIESDCKVTVEESKESKDSAKPKIVSGLVPTKVAAGDTAMFSVKVDGNVTGVKWFKDGKEIKNGEVKDLGDGTYQLVVPNTSANDAGTYKVVVSNDNGTAESSAALTVKLPPIELVKKLEDSSVPAGDQAVLEIVTNRKPKSIRWFKNGKEISSKDKPQMKDCGNNKYQLVIPNTTADDAAEYKVVVGDDNGTIQSSAALTVKLPQIELVKKLEDCSVAKGDQAVLEIETNRKPKSIRWYKNGKELGANDKPQMKDCGNNKYQLVIPNTTGDDDADYKVVVSDDNGTIESSAAVTVKEPQIELVKNLEDCSVAKGDQAVLEIETNRKPKSIKWFKNGKELGANDKPQIKDCGNNKYQLVIPNSTENDGADYKVVVTDENGSTVTSSCALTVKLPQQKPEFLKELGDVTVPYGDPLRLEVKMNGPPRSVKWYKEGRVLAASARANIVKVDNNTYVLEIPKTEAGDSGTYEVEIENDAGSAKSTGKVTVEPSIVWVKPLQDQAFAAGSPLVFDVKVAGRVDDVKWLKDGKPVTPSAKLVTEDLGNGRYRLTIPIANEADAGTYTVQVGNDNAAATSDANAILDQRSTRKYPAVIKPGEFVLGPSFVTPLNDTNVDDGDVLLLKCRLRGEPFPDVVWYKDGVEVPKDNRCAMRVATDGTVTLCIKDVKESDLGEYKVVARNAGGESSRSCMVFSASKPPPPCAPHFIIPLRSGASAALGDKKEFTVKARGIPASSLRYYLNGKPLPLDDRVELEDLGAGNFCLTFKNVQDEDFGTLKCVAENENGREECEAEFTKTTVRRDRERADGKYPPRFNVNLWDRRIPVNELLSLECHVDAKPHATIEWFKNGLPLVVGGKVEVRNTTDGACRVRIDPFGNEDVAVYSCVAKNELGVAETQATYTVKIAEEMELVEKRQYAPRFRKGMADVTVNAGKAVRLQCLVDGVPKPAIVWYRDGVPIRSDGHVRLEYKDDGNCSLSIENATEEDEGAYRCVASNILGSTNNCCLVTVKAPKVEVKKEGAEPEFLRKLADSWNDRGETFTLTCTVTGDPMPDVKWYRNGVVVRNGGRVHFTNEADGVCTITVKDCVMTDEGTYRCEIENKHGRAMSQSVVHVMVPIGKGEKLEDEDGSPPRFGIPLDDFTFTAGETIELKCRVTGQPRPSVKWTRDGAPIPDDCRYIWDVDEDKGMYQLKIYKADVQDEGTFRCVASNSSGSATTKSLVRTNNLAPRQAPVQSSPPRFTIKLGDGRATEGQMLKFECKVEGSPLPTVAWNKDGKEIVSSDRIQISMSPEGVARLIIPRCSVDDEGIYRVIATNTAGIEHDRGNVTVKRAPPASAYAVPETSTASESEGPKLVEPLENLRVPEKQELRMRCKFSANPKPTIKWFRNGERVFQAAGIQLIEKNSGVCELVVESITRKDAGGYRCVAENEHGTARTTADVSVIRDRSRLVLT